jgi:hypothetical protein
LIVLWFRIKPRTDDDKLQCVTNDW